MSLGELIVYLVIALLCGFAGQMLAGRSVGGYAVAAAFGLIGALLGSTIARSIGAPEPLRLSIGGRTIQTVRAIIGAFLVTFLVASPPALHGRFAGALGGRAIGPGRLVFST